MPFIPHTPESLISRSDSKNPATTCKGITGKGIPCRRDLKSKTKSGVLALAPVETGDGLETDAAAFFCWQHKDQAENLVHKNNDANRNYAGTTSIIPLQKRTSLDTLYERLGVLEDEETMYKDAKKQSPRSESKADRRSHRPPTWDNVEGPIMTVPRKSLPHPRPSIPAAKPDPLRRPPKAKPTLLEIFCCGAGVEDDDYIEVVKHKTRREQTVNPVQRPRMEHPQTFRQELVSRPSPTSESPADRHVSGVKSEPNSGANRARPTIHQQPSSHTSNLLSVIPDHLAPQITSQLLTELSKPISSYDEEGYIYIFQLTPQDSPNTPSKAAKLLTAETPPHSRSRRPSTGNRRVSDVSTTSNRTSDGKLLLKIGRASNIQRRMNEWTRQCGYALELVRWYPHIPSSSSSATPSPNLSPATSPSSRRSPNATPNVRRVSDAPLVRKIPHSHRVERLIHLELAERRVRKACEVCGKEHREWFEIEAGREGVRLVDEVVRRWVGWDEGQETTA
ncbi:DUF1766-domain-containing protein [Viridothelium virens]|uniref:DUF1766-domain-containing protein n=1 Tax=Viridothelium virens TaxID=1048519 RepID=A0A6A6HLJ1_VIRVR|nr:DUF1766-domain-containing protein [Viridothelium virens]